MTRSGFWFVLVPWLIVLVAVALCLIFGCAAKAGDEVVSRDIGHYRSPETKAETEQQSGDLIQALAALKAELTASACAFADITAAVVSERDQSVRDTAVTQTGSVNVAKTDNSVNSKSITWGILAALILLAIPSPIGQIAKAIRRSRAPPVK